MSASLVIEDFEGAKTVVPLGDDEVTIGRLEGNTIQLTEKNVSRSHARLRLVDDGWQLEDLQSYNGVRLNGELIEGASLIHEGDLIQIGDYQLTLGEGAGAMKATVDMGPGGSHAPVSLTAANETPAPSIAASEELDPAMARPPMPAVAVPAPVTGAYDAAPKKRGGLVVLALLLVGGGGAGFYFWQQSQAANGPGEAAVATSADAAEPKETVEPGPAPEPEAGADTAAADTAGALADGGSESSETESTGDAGDAGDDGGDADAEDGAGAADDGAAEDGAGAADDGAAVEAPEPEPEPTPAPVAKKKKKKKKKSASELLSDARKAQLAGRYSSAYSLAKRAYSAQASQEAAQVMGVAACKMGDAKKAKSALSKLSGGKKSALKSVCAGAGISL